MGPTVQSPTTTYVTDLTGQVVQRVDGNGVIKERFFYFNGVKVGQVEGAVADFDRGYTSMKDQEK